MYVICDIDSVKEGSHEPSDVNDAIINYFGYTKSPLLLRQFLRCMENLIYAYVWDELPERCNSLEKQMNDWVNKICDSSDFVVDKDMDEICIMSSDDGTVSIACTPTIVTEYQENLYDDYSCICYEQSDVLHVDMLYHVLFTLSVFLIEKRVINLEIICDDIELLLYRYTPDQLMLDGSYDIVKYLVNFCTIKPIL